jgi:hypothetical protein
MQSKLAADGNSRDLSCFRRESEKKPQNHQGPIFKAREGNENLELQEMSSSYILLGAVYQNFL